MTFFALWGEWGWAEGETPQRLLTYQRADQASGQSAVSSVTLNMAGTASALLTLMP